jgi:hypothetical protein
MFENLKRRRAARHERLGLSEIDARLLRRMGLNPEDIDDALTGRRSSVLFTPFRQPRD